MKKRIEIPGYEVVLPNNVWWREDQQEHEGAEHPAKEIIQINRFSGPSERKTLNAIVRAAKERLGGGLTQEMVVKNPLLYSVDDFSRDVLRQIAIREKGIMERLKTNCPHTKYKQGREYIEFERGVVLDDTREKHAEGFKQMGAKQDQNFYTSILRRSGLDYQNVVLRLENKALPDRVLIDSLLDPEVFVIESKIMWMNAYREERDVYAARVELLYDLFDNPEKIRLLLDNSRLKVLSEASSTIERAVKELAEENPGDRPPELPPELLKSLGAFLGSLTPMIISVPMPGRPLRPNPKKPFSDN